MERLRGPVEDVVKVTDLGWGIIQFSLLMGKGQYFALLKWERAIICIANGEGAIICIGIYFTQRRKNRIENSLGSK